MATKKTILFIEDNALTCKLYDENLKHAGYDVLCAGNSADGLELAFKKHPDLILLDIVMPEPDGMGTLKMLRKDDWGKTVPVIIVTNLSDMGKTAESLQAGVTDYLIKSDWKMADIIAKINNKLK